MSSEEYRNALENMHKLVDELEDVTIENEVLTQENIELEKDVQFISEKHNETVEGIKKLAYNTRNYRINNVNQRHHVPQCHCNEVEEHKCQCEKCNPPMNVDMQNSNVMNKLSNKFAMFKNKLIFIVALLLVIMLAIGASPSNVISWKAFTDLYIEFICNPATMAMAVALVVLLYKGIVKRKNK